MANCENDYGNMWLWMYVLYNVRKACLEEYQVTQKKKKICENSIPVLLFECESGKF